jgi:hypothetical protein
LLTGGDEGAHSISWGLTTRGVVEGTMIVGRFHLHQRHLWFDGFWERRNNLTSKFKTQGPNTSKRITATIGPRKGRNQVLEGIYSGRNLSFKRLLLRHLACWRM